MGMRLGLSISPPRPTLIGSTLWSKTRKAPQKRVRRTQILLLSAESPGMNPFMYETGKSQTCVRRWQEGSAAEGVGRPF
jgi:hypothetical protein